MSGRIEGWLLKSGLLPSSRHRRYCVLADHELRYYKHASDSRPAGTLDLRRYTLQEKSDSKNDRFQLVSDCRHHRHHSFYADNERDLVYWLDGLRVAMRRHTTKKHCCSNTCASLNPSMMDSVGVDSSMSGMISPLSSASTTSSSLFSKPYSEDSNYSVLDKWLDRLDLNDRPSGMPSSSSHLDKPLSSSLSPSLLPYRSSTESLESLPSEATLSTSVGTAKLSPPLFVRNKKPQSLAAGSHTVSSVGVFEFEMDAKYRGLPMQPVPTTPLPSLPH
ncbi:hypothetical protein BC940DRAFT_349030 [Gongronella butleri]|nr:hypothetical protein BC940DRAFT_349030 [Gongronella butleri]